MNCPRCGSPSHVLATRPGPHLTTRRSRQCDHKGHRFTTVEIHAACEVGATPRLIQFASMVRKRLALLARNAYIVANLHRGWRPLAAKFNLTKTSIYAANRSHK